MTNFTIDDRHYHVRRFEPDEHVSLLLLLSPTFAALAAASKDLVAAQQNNSESDQPGDPLGLLSDLGRAAGPVAEKVADLARRGDDKIIVTACMKATDQIVEGKPHPVMTKAGVISNQVANGTYVAKLKITINVIRIHFGASLKSMGVDVDALMGGSPDAGV